MNSLDMRETYDLQFSIDVIIPLHWLSIAQRHNTAHSNFVTSAAKYTVEVG